MLILPTPEEMVDKNHPVRIVNQVIDQIDIDPLFVKHKGGGISSYHPRMLLKFDKDQHGNDKKHPSLQTNSAMMKKKTVIIDKPGNRVIEVNHQLRLLKAKARELLLSEQGIKHRKKRPWDVEPVFGNIKYNKGFKRFMLRGCDKVEIEVGLLSIAHNLKKWSC